MREAKAYGLLVAIMALDLYLLYRLERRMERAEQRLEAVNKTVNAVEDQQLAMREQQVWGSR